MREKERRDFATILYHTCASWHLVLHIESLMLCHFHMLVGITFSLLETWLVYSNDGLPQMPEVFMRKQVGCTPHLASVELSYTYSSSASFTWQSLLLALISIDEHLHSSLVRLVDARLSSPLFTPLIPTTIFYSTYMLCPMVHAHVLHEDYLLYF